MIIIILVFSVPFLVRFIHLTADPPYNLSSSGAPWGDPGGYSFNARNKILFGSWEVDDYNMMYTSYPPHLITYSIFRLFGVGLAQQNSVPVFFSCLSLLFIFLILRRRHDPKTALLGAVLLSFNYTFLMYSRIANRVMPSVLFMILGIYLLQKGKKSPWINIAAGLSLALALLSKSVVFYAVGAIGLGYFLWLFFEYRIKDILLRLAALLAGALVALIPWALFIFLPKQNDILSFSRLNTKYLIPPANPAKLLKNFWTRPALLLEQMPLLTILGALFSLYLLYKAVHNPRQMQLTDWVFLSWFLIGFLYLSLIYQRVPRRFVAQIIPVLFMAVSAIALSFRKKRAEKIAPPKIFFLPLSLIWMLYPASLILKFFWKKTPKLFSSQGSLNISLISLSLLLSLVLFFALKALSQKSNISLKRTWKMAVFLAAAALFMASHGSRYLRWAFNPPHQIRDISRDYGRAFQKAVFAGLWAPAISIENTHRAYEYFRGIINDDKNFFKKFSITHIFTTTAFGEDQIFRQDFPHVMEHARLIARYHIWTVQALLFDVKPVSKEVEDGFFEAELFTLRGSTPRYDDKASGKFAVFYKKKKPHNLIAIHVEKNLEKGVYKVSFRMRPGKPVAGLKTRVARLVIVSEEGKKGLGYRDIFPGDFSSTEYRTFSFPLRLREASPIEIYLHSDGISPVWLDWIRLE